MYRTGPMDHLNYPLHVQPQGGLFSMVKDTDRPAFWSDGPQNKYDPKETKTITTQQNTR